MASSNPVISSCWYSLIHLPDLVRYGSRPRRDIAKDATVESEIQRSLRGFADASAYPPNLVFTGQLAPQDLAAIERPWFQMMELDSNLPIQEAFGEIVDQDSFFAWLKAADVLHPPLFELTDHGEKLVNDVFSQTRKTDVLNCLKAGIGAGTGESMADEHSLQIWSGETLIGRFHGDTRSEGRGDLNVGAVNLLESLTVKTSGAMALSGLLKRSDVQPDQIDYIISCGEEACGDRYQRGGGGMAKAIGEMCGCANASGMDVKNFCAAPASAIVTAGSMIKAGLYKRIAIVGGGSLAKLGMKYRAFLNAGVPILDDCLGSMAFLLTCDDGESPTIHLEPGAIGLASIGASSSEEAIYRKLVLKPLDTLGLKMTDVDKYAPELHNPEIMQFAGSGDVASKNYKMLAAMAVLSGTISKDQRNEFIKRISMPGFAPTQGHIPSGVPYLGHAIRSLKNESTGLGQEDDLRRVMFVCKASLFLNRITELFDGVSFMLERNR